VCDGAGDQAHEERFEVVGVEATSRVLPSHASNRFSASEIESSALSSESLQAAAARFVAEIVRSRRACNGADHCLIRRSCALSASTARSAP